MLHSSLDDILLLEENRFNVAPGLAANVWCTFLSKILKGDFKFSYHHFLLLISDHLDDLFRETFSDYVKDVREAIISRNDTPNTASSLDIFNKLIILLPEDCTIDMKTFDKERVYQHVPGLCDMEHFSDEKPGQKCVRDHQVCFEGRM